MSKRKVLTYLSKRVRRVVRCFPPPPLTTVESPTTHPERPEGGAPRDEMSGGGSELKKRPVEAEDAEQDKRTKAEAGPSSGTEVPAWKTGGASGKSLAETLRKEETMKAVSSIKGKLSAKKVIGKSLEDERKTKHGTHSAGLSREQILASQARHKEKMEALGKPVPVYSSIRK